MTNVVHPDYRRPSARIQEPQSPPAPTGDPLIDEVRRIKFEFAARFNHDLDRIFEHLRTEQEEMERQHPGRLVRRSSTAGTARDTQPEA